MSRTEIRRRNFPKEFPFTTAIGLLYDSGDYDKTLDRLLELVGRQGDVRAAAGGGGRRAASCSAAASRPRSRSAGSSRRTSPDALGLTPRRLGDLHRARAPDRQGHGDHRHLAARPGPRDVVVADRRDRARHALRRRRGDPRRHGVRPLRARHVRQPQPRRRRHGGVRWRRARCATRRGSSPPTCSRRRPTTSSSPTARSAVKGSPDKRTTIQEVAFRAWQAFDMPEGVTPGLDETVFHDPPNFMFPFGAHGCEVEVDRDTGKVEITGYIAVDDCGIVINPMIVDGQVHGGVVHGIGQALYEDADVRRRGPAVTGTLVDYLVPSAADVPPIETAPHRDALADEPAGRQGHRRGGHDRLHAGGGRRRVRRARRPRPRHAAAARAVWQAMQQGRRGMIPRRSIRAARVRGRRGRPPAHARRRRPRARRRALAPCR